VLLLAHLLLLRQLLCLQQLLLCLWHCQLQLLLQVRKQLRALQLLLQRSSQSQHLLQLQQQCKTWKSMFEHVHVCTYSLDSWY
jgi:hypothetical protein